MILAVLLLHGFVDGHYVSFRQAMQDVLLAGGDTDTNACICGYIVGAICGYGSDDGKEDDAAAAAMLPLDMCDRLTRFDCTRVRMPHHPHEFNSLMGRRLSYGQRVSLAGRLALSRVLPPPRTRTPSSSSSSSSSSCR